MNHKSNKKTITSNDKYDSMKYWIEYGIDLEKRRISLDDDITEYTVGWCTRAIRKMLESDDKSPIDIYINSYGGFVYDGLALYDILKDCPCTIRTHVEGKAMSMALIVLLAGDERYCLENSTFMAHSIASGSIGKLFELEVDLKESKRLMEIMLAILESGTVKSLTWWRNKIKHEDFYFNKDIALELGVLKNTGKE